MANAMDIFKKFYSELTKVLPMIINILVTTFYSRELLSGNHKGRIVQFDEMLKVMTNSDDPAVKYLVDEMQKLSTSSSVSSVDQNQPTTCKGITIL